MNKKGGEKWLSPWWILVLALVGISVVGAVGLFHGAEADVRGIEARILHNNLMKCFIENGILKEEALNEEFDIFSICNLNKEVLDNEDFYVKIKIVDEQGGLLRDEIRIGANYEVECELKNPKEFRERKIEFKDSPGCFNSKEQISYFVNGNNLKGGIEVFTASRQRGSKIPLANKK